MKTLLTLCLFLIASLASAQTAILTPQGNLICLPGSIVTTCAGSDGGLTIMQLGPQTYAITPMTPTRQTYPSLEEPTQPRESSTPLFFGTSEAKPEGRFEVEAPKVPCYSLWKEC